MVDEAPLERQIEDGWGLSGVKIVDERVSYPTRKVLRLSSDHGEFAAKLFEDLTPGEVSSQIETLIAVRQRGFLQAPDVLATQSGRCVAMTTVGSMVVTEYAPVALDESDRASTWADLGSALAALNAMTGGRPFSIPIDAALRDQVDRADGTPFAAGVRRLVQRLGHLSSCLSTGVIHGEANPSNAARRATGELVLLDWDQAGVGPRALDYGYPLVTCHISETLQVDEIGIHAFFGAYRGQGGSVDVSLAIDAALFHALRYMWFANTEARWERIEFALQNESNLAELIL